MLPCHGRKWVSAQAVAVRGATTAAQVHFQLLCVSERDAVAVKPSVDGFTAEAEAAGKFADVGLWVTSSVRVLSRFGFSKAWGYPLVGTGLVLPMCPVHPIGRGTFPVHVLGLMRARWRKSWPCQTVPRRGRFLCCQQPNPSRKSEMKIPASHVRKASTSCSFSRNQHSPTIVSRTY